METQAYNVTEAITKPWKQRKLLTQSHLPYNSFPYTNKWRSYLIDLLLNANS